MNKIVDIDKCELRIDKPSIVINSNTKLSDLKRIGKYNYTYSSSTTKKYRDCTIGLVLIDGYECFPRFSFENENITFIEFSVCPFDDGSWDHWSKEDQIKYKEWNDQWLLKVTGKKPPFKSKHGEIDSVFDLKAADSYICFAYPQNRGK